MKVKYKTFTDSSSSIVHRLFTTGNCLTEHNVKRTSKRAKTRTFATTKDPNASQTRRMKRTHIIGLIIIAAGVGFLIWMLSAEFSRYETFGSEFTQAGREVNVVGELDTEKELYYDPHVDANYFSFYMTDDDGETRKVVYNGTKPRDFERSEKIVVVGKLEGEDFLASKILMKCPSKYVEEELTVAS